MFGYGTALYSTYKICLLLPPLHQNTPVVTDIEAVIPLDSLLVNLIRGSLLPQALLWLTGRRAATNQIPPEYIHRVTEIQGYRCVWCLEGGMGS